MSTEKSRFATRAAPTPDQYTCRSLLAGEPIKPPWRVARATPTVETLSPHGQPTGYRILFENITPTGAQVLHGDAAPLVNGISVPDGTININDLLLLQRKLFGLVYFP